MAKYIVNSLTNLRGRVHKFIHGSGGQKIYIASHDRWAALHVAGALVEAGHEITSRWIKQPFHPVEHHTGSEREVIAILDFEDVCRADVLVLIASDDKGPGGKFVEAGIAIGRNKQVIVLGRRENMLMWLPQVWNVSEVGDIVRLLAC